MRRDYAPPAVQAPEGTTIDGHAARLTDDERWSEIEAAITRTGRSPDALIEVLHIVQERFGYLSRDALDRVSEALGVARSRAYGVATFYSFFTLEPPGRHTCVVCTGTACYIDGSTAILDRIAGALHVGAGETSSDGAVSVLAARCIGTCSLAPLIVLDDEVIGRVTPDDVLARLEQL